MADDVVELMPTDDGRVTGSSPERIRHHLEIRGLGIIYVPDLFGPGCVCDGSVIDLVCQLEWWREGVAYERVGLDRDSQELAGVTLPRLVLPSRPGANMATIVEVAAREHQRRSQGLNAAVAYHHGGVRSGRGAGSVPDGGAHQSEGGSLGHDGGWVTAA